MFKKQFSAPEVADLLGISRIAVFNRIKSGNIKAQKVGRNYVIDKENLQEYLKLSELPEREKKRIDQAVERAVEEYGETFKMLGDE